jgi:hypothetical protein
MTASAATVSKTSATAPLGARQPSAAHKITVANMPNSPDFTSPAILKAHAHRRTAVRLHAKDFPELRSPRPLSRASSFASPGSLPLKSSAPNMENVSSGSASAARQGTARKSTKKNAATKRLNSFPPVLGHFLYSENSSPAGKSAGQKAAG